MSTDTTTLALFDRVQQSEPVKRRVALKVIKPGMDSREVLSRFGAERQALAMMDHPNIARVLDAGTTDSGRPFFVMELVRGIPITQFCDKNRLSPKERLQLFVDVCHAIQHAHQKGIIHRDIKPGNVLVASQDGRPLVKVIDFGVAKAINQQLTDDTVYTQLSQMLGTPLYMSPEQAEMSAEDVDTRSDIYSLGVLLYELLTGRPTFDKERFRQAAYDELRRMIREEEPSKPSDKISTLGEAGSNISLDRGTDPRKLSQLLRGELDWIVMKALEKDRERRYETANGFAMDSGRYLCGEAVEAAPPSASYRMQKFIRRNKVAFATTGVVAASLLLGIAVASWQAVIANAAYAEAARERDEKTLALEAETKVRKQAMSALRVLSSGIVDNQMARGTKLTEENKRFLRKIIKQYEGFAALTADDAESLAVRAEGYSRVGAMRARLGESKEAEAAFTEALFIRRQLVDEYPDRPEFRHQLAMALYDLGRIQSASGRLKETEAAYHETLAIVTPLATEFPDQPKYRDTLSLCQSALGFVLRFNGRLTEGEAAYREALAIRKRLVDESTTPQRRDDLATSYKNLGVVLRVRGQLDKAEAAFRDGLAVQEALVDESPTPDFRERLALSHLGLGMLLQQAGKIEDAEAAFRKSLAIQKKLADEFPLRTIFRETLAGSYLLLGNLFLGAFSDRLEEAETAYREALAIRRRLVDYFPDRPGLHRDLGVSHQNLGHVLYDTDRMEEAGAAYREALAIRKSLADELGTPASRGHLAGSHTNLAILLKDTGQLKEAEAAYGESLAISKQLASEFGTQPDVRNRLANALNYMSYFHCHIGQFAEAVAYVELTKPHHQMALKANPQHPTYRQYYRNTLDTVIQAYAGLLDQTSAVRAGTELRDLGWDPPIDAYQAARAISRCIPIVRKADQLDAPKREAAAKFYGDEAMAMLRAAVSQGWKKPSKLKKDTALDSVRARDDFKKLLAELENLPVEAPKP